MTRQHIVTQIKKSKAVAVIRMDDASNLIPALEALYKGGITVFEITLTIPNAIELIKEAREHLSNDTLIGVGSVITKEQAKQAIQAGAQFVVSPIFKSEIVKAAHEDDIAVMPGAFTPTEVQVAYEAGADLIKVFPADVLGMGFFKAVKAPMPHVELMPTGGVNLTNAKDWLKAGACAVGLGSALFDQQAAANGNFDQLTRNAELLMDNLR